MIPLSKIQDVCMYLGLADDMEGLEGIAEVRLVPNKVIVLRYAEDEDGSRRINLNGSVMLTDQVIDVVEGGDDEDEDSEAGPEPEPELAPEPSETLEDFAKRTFEI